MNEIDLFPKKGMRLWPALLILVLTAAYITWVWLSPGDDRQAKVMQTAEKAILSIVLLFLWLAFFSRIQWPLRVGLLLATLALFVMAGLLLDVQAVTGDLVPIIKWRWEEKHDHSLDATPQTSPGENLDTASTELDFPGFLGQNRDGKIRDVTLSRDWSSHPPQEIWRQPVGAGWSSFAIVGGIAITQEQRGDSEIVAAYSKDTGKPIWKHAEITRYENRIGGDGPRATPSISGNQVFALGATGRLVCLELKTGKRIWSRDVLADTVRFNLDWGISCSPLVLDDRVIVSSGGNRPADEEADPDSARIPAPIELGEPPTSLVAYDRNTGEILWNSGTDACGYSSPILATFFDIPQVIIFNQASLASHDAESGRQLWSHPWSATQPNVSEPLILAGNRVLASSGYGQGCKLLEVKRVGESLRVEVVWESRFLRAKFTNLVVKDNHFYGLDDGILACIKMSDGTRVWKGGRYGHGQILLVGDLLLVQAEDGGIVLVAADPEKHTEIGRASALDSKTWNHPALQGSTLLVRNDREAVCFRLTLQ